MSTIEQEQDYDYVAGGWRPVSPEDAAFRAGLALGRGEGRLGLDADDVPLGLDDRLDPHLHAAHVAGYRAARWEVEGSRIAG